MKRQVVPTGALTLAGAMVAGSLAEAVARTVREGPVDFVWNWGLAETSIAVNFAVVGGLLAARRPRNPIGWLLLLQAWQAVAGLVGVDAIIAVPWAGVLAATVLLFPHGRPMSSAQSGLLWAVGLACATIVAGDRTGVRVGDQTLWDVLEPMLVAALAAAVVGLVVQYRRGTGLERLQLRALASACAFAVVSLFVTVPFGLLPIVNAFAIPAVAWGLAVAVLRHRLYDLDRLISRTVSYVLLSLALAGVYAAVVFGLQAILRPETSSDLAVAVATLTAAALFTPLRRRLQRGVDRRFNRARYDAEATVAAFAGALRDQLEVDVLIGAMRDVVARSVQPSFATVWTANRESGRRPRLRPRSR